MSLDSIMPVSPTGFGGNMFSGGSSDWIVFLIIAIIFGWGNGGLGGMGGGRGAIANAVDNSFISNEFNYTNLANSLKGIERGLCDVGDSVLRTTASQGEATRTAITNASFANERGIANLSAQLAQCCCDTQKELLTTRYENSKNTCDIITNANMNTRDLIQAGNANTQRIIDMMTQNELQALRDKNTALTLQVSQQNQTASIVNALKPTPVPAYVVGSPYCGA